MQAISRPIPKPLDVAKYDPLLTACDVIDCNHPAIQERAELLSYGVDGDDNIAKVCFEWVRDEIEHSVDYERGPVTCKASDVLEYGTGFCYAKSHLLAALLRANGVPTGMCYQRLRGTHQAFVLHGLNIVHLPRYGWYRMDARGNAHGIDAQFSPPHERLAWTGKKEGEINFREIWATPMPQSTQVLHQHTAWKDVYENLPDVRLV